MSEPIEKALKVFREYLKKKNMRQTMERENILRKIYTFQGHFDIETLQEALEEDNFHVSLATLYNTLEVLMDSGLIVRHQFGTHAPKYERLERAQNYWQLVCSQCGEVREFKENNLSQEIKTKKIPKFTVGFGVIYVYGICSKCRYANNRKKRNKKI